MAPIDETSDSGSHSLASERSRGTHTYERLKNAIVTGQFAPGTPLLETQLAKWYGVSRTPVREALTRLVQDGLVRRTGRGLVVHESTRDEILDVYSVRTILEEHAARTAAERRTSNDLALMRIAANRMAAHDIGGQGISPSLSTDFHRAVWRATHNEALFDALERVSMHLGRYRETTLAYEGRWQRSCEQHKEIMAAIEMRDSARAGELATLHYNEARDIRLKQWAADCS